MNKQIVTLVVAILVSLGVGFFAGMEYTKEKIRKEFTKAANEISTSLSGIGQQSGMSNDASPTAPPVFVDKNMNDEITLATMKVKITNAEEKNVIQSRYSQPKVAEQGSKFVVLTATVENITNSPFSFSDSGIPLVDQKERIFQPYSDTIGNIDNYLDVQELSPNIPKTGVIVYQVPEDAASYSFMLGKAGTNEAYRIKIK